MREKKKNDTKACVTRSEYLHVIADMFCDATRLYFFNLRQSVMASLAAQRFSALLRQKSPHVVQSTRTYVAVALRNSAYRPTVSAKPAAVLLQRAQITTESETAKPEEKKKNNNGNNTTVPEGTPAAEIPPPAVGDMNGNGLGAPTDWSKSYHGLSSQAFSKEAAEILLSPIDPVDIEIKPGKHRFVS
jgi:hypothetical protein